MVRVALAVTAVLVLVASRGAVPHPAVMPPLTFEDQDGRKLALADLRGRVAIIVYGTRAGLEHHVVWGKRLDSDLRARHAYRAHDAPAARPVQILALAQMGGIPDAFRPVLRSLLRGHVETGYSLWLDWDDRMSALFGSREAISTVVVVDRAGAVRLVVSGPAEGDPYQAVTRLLDQLL